VIVTMLRILYMDDDPKTSTPGRNYQAWLEHVTDSILLGLDPPRKLHTMKRFALAILTAAVIVIFLVLNMNGIGSNGQHSDVTMTPDGVATYRIK
jgi:hypothetical protein